MTFDRIDSAVERETAVELLCDDVDARTRDRVASAILEYDRRRYVAAKRVHDRGAYGIDMDDVEQAVDAAIEAVRKGKR